MGLHLRLLLTVGLGGAIGSAARFELGNLIQARSSGSFPFGTLVINVTGSFLLGFLVRIGLDTASVSPDMRLLLAVGVCGGYTTFSTFSYESIHLIERGEYGRAAVYVAGSVILSLAATAAGLAVARWAAAAGGLDSLS